MYIGCIAYKINDDSEFANTGPISRDLAKKFAKILDDHMYKEEFTKLISGVNVGPDFLFAYLAIERNIPLKLYISHIEPIESWNMTSTVTYNNIVTYKGCEQIYISKLERYAHEYKINCIVDESDLIIIVNNEERKYYIDKAIDLAKCRNKETIIIDPIQIKKECPVLY